MSNTDQRSNYEKLRQTFAGIKARGIRRTVSLCWSKLHEKRLQFLASPTGCLETLLYSEMHMITKTLCVPFKMQSSVLDVSSIGGVVGISHQLEPAEGLQLLVTVVVQVLVLARSSLLLPILADKLVVMSGDMFTLDAVVYAIVVICLAVAHIGGINATVSRRDFATIFNSFVISSNSYARKS